MVGSPCALVASLYITFRSHFPHALSDGFSISTTQCAHLSTLPPPLLGNFHNDLLHLTHADESLIPRSPVLHIAHSLG